MLDRLDHVVILVDDLDVATHDYARLLGRDASWRGVHPAYGTADAVFRLDNTCIQLVSAAERGEIAEELRKRLEERGEGVSRLGFATSDADALGRELRRRGLSASAPIPGEGRNAGSSALRVWRNVFIPCQETRGLRISAIEMAQTSDPLPKMKPDGPAVAAVHALDHAVIRSQDPDASARLFGEQLGLRLALDRTFEERGLRLLFFRVGGVTIEIAATLAAGDPQASDAFWGLAYRVGDVDAARERLLREGVEVSEARTGHKPGTRVCTVHAPTHGVATLLIGPDAGSA